MLKTLKAAALMCGLLFVHLPNAHAAWQTIYAGNPIPWNAVTNSVLGSEYLCRATYEGGVHPGWTSSSKGTCAFSWGGLEHDAYIFDIWVESWQPASNGNVPANAIPFGYERPPVPYPGLPATRERYACQATDPAGGLASGKVAPDLGACFFPWGGLEYHAASYNVLVDAELAMVDSTGGPKTTIQSYDPSVHPSVGAYATSVYYDMPITSGYEADGSLLYLCSVYYQDGYQIGKIGGGAGYGGCDISYGGAEVRNVNPYLLLNVGWEFEPTTNSNFSDGELPIDLQIGAISNQYPGGLYESPIIAGHEADGSNLYACIAFTPGETGLYTPGKISKALGNCSYAQNGKEVFASGATAF